jgi:hypothetical protein
VFTEDYGATENEESSSSRVGVSRHLVQAYRQGVVRCASSAGKRCRDPKSGVPSQFAPRRFRVSFDAIGAKTTLTTTFETIGAATSKDLQPENAQTIDDNPYRPILARVFICAIARPSQRP